MSSHTCYQDVTAYQDTESKISVMKDLYVGAIDELPPNAPKPRGLHIHINFCVYSDLVCDRVARRSHTGMLLYFNSAHIILYSKQENNVERSIFGLGFWI